ncbi:MAG: sensor histidine kinase, partial [Cyanophyceae cyanobacterium]
VIVGVVDQLRDQVLEAELTLAVDLPEVLPPIAADGDRLHQILVNLLSNALRHTSTGTITVWARRFSPQYSHPENLPSPDNTQNNRAQNNPDKNSLWLGVTDTGEGIAAESLSYIFERFWQGDVSRDRQGAQPPSQRRTSGAGIGLAITKQLVERHGGKIVAVSEQHRGSTFYFDLPLAKTGWK